VPLKALIRGLGLALVGSGALAACVAAALHSAPPVRLPALFALATVVALGIYCAWLYLPDVSLAPRRGRRGRRRVALTFDDGPNGADTARVLDVLARHGARATFFCVGEAARRHPELVRRMVADGHVVGNHTLEHRKLPWCSPAEVARQIEGAQAAIIDAGAPPPTLFRAPHGFKSPFLGGVLARLSLRLVSWTHGVWDTDRPGAAEIVRRSVRRLDDGVILLLHDGTLGADRAQTAEALDAILIECARRGLRPVTLPELLETA
jgi:peptidoglycan/xylan/chitin deacetylase (PgdA/CDA1 family)